MGNLVKKDNGLMTRNSNSFFNEYFDAMDKMVASVFEPMKNELNNVYSKAEQYGLKSQHRLTDDELIYSLPVAGCSEDDVSVEIEGNKLFIEAGTDSDTFESTYSTHFTVDENKYNLDGIEAKVENGLLTITLPFNKSDPSNGSKRKIM